MTKYSLEKNSSFRHSVGMYQAFIMLTDVMIKNKLRRGREDLI